MRADELRTYHEADRAEKRLSKLTHNTPWNPWSTTASHALQQVRVNGREALITLIDLHDEGLQYLKDVDEHLEEMREAREIIASTLERLVKRFVKCPACDGEKGRKETTSGVYVYHWIDCETCDGRGMLPVGAREWQDENRTYTPAERQLDVRIDGHTERLKAA